MQISIELKDGKQRLGRVLVQTEEGKKEFNKLVDKLMDDIFSPTKRENVVACSQNGVHVVQDTEVEIVKFEEIQHPKDTYEEQSKAEKSSETNKKKFIPEVLSEEVVVPEEFEKDKNLKARQIMLVVRCDCGKIKIFKTLENGGKKFKCDCGKEYPIENTVPIIAE